jgi:hypothetical protein
MLKLLRLLESMALSVRVVEALLERQLQGVALLEELLPPSAQQVEVEVEHVEMEVEVEHVEMEVEVEHVLLDDYLLEKEFFVVQYDSPLSPPELLLHSH